MDLDELRAQTPGCLHRIHLNTSREFADLAGDCDVDLSLGRTGQCWDNALAESFFSSLKGELIDTRPWPTRARARRATESVNLDEAPLAGSY